jgi:CheY-like chemotaxis protein
MACVVVSDSGKGIAQEFLPFVFERFRQDDGSSTRRVGGLGLGLSIVRHLVEAHGGVVTAASEGEGRGATFTLSLPLLDQHGLAVRGDAIARESGNGESPRASARLESLSIVVVDDERDTRELVATVLRQHGADVLALESAGEAYRAIAVNPPHVLLADVAMPGEDGYSLMRRVRMLDGASAERLPAAALTAYARPEDRAEAFAAGFQLHVPKPVDPEHIVEVVESLAGRR